VLADRVEGAILSIKMIVNRIDPPFCPSTNLVIESHHSVRGLASSSS